MDEFIENVKNNSPIWNADDIHYKNVKVKDSIWTTIAKNCKMKNINEAKHQWKKLRDSLREAMKREKKSELEFKPKRLWMYREQMEFLVPFMTHRKNSNVTHIEVIVKEEEEASGQVDDYLWEDLDEPIEESLDEDMEIFEVPKKKMKIQKELETLTKQEEEEKLVRTVDLDHQNLFLEHQSNDSLKEFFNSMYLVTAAMSKSHQLIIKRKLFDAVTEAEVNLQSTNGTEGLFASFQAIT